MAKQANVQTVQLPEKLSFLFEPHRYKVAYGGRGGAKSWGFARALIIQSGMSRKRILCTREYQSSILESVHHLIADQIEALGLQSKFYVTNTSIQGANGSEFIFAGLKNDPQKIKSTEGVDIVWVEEAQKVSNTSWEILIPTIRQAGSEIWVSYNPDEEFDPTHVRFVTNTPPGAQVVKMGWEDNPWFPPELEAERAYLETIDPEAYANVWGGECRRHSQGSYYGQQLIAAMGDGRITSVPPDPALLTHTFWDLGISDYTSIWFAQFAGQEIHLIDYYEMSGEGLEHYARVLNQKALAHELLYGEHWAPHDIAARELGLGKSRLETAKSLGIGFRVVKLSPRSPGRGIVAEGIEAVRGILHKCWFDETRCAVGLNRLKRYRKEWLAKHQCWSDSPVHDENSHGADAFRSLAMALKLGAGDNRFRLQGKPDRYSPRKKAQGASGWAA
jgi:phage terminase large subunit